MKRLLLIVNPRSGKGSIRNRLLDVADIFVKAGYDVTIYISQQPRDARNRVIRSGSFFDVVVCSGGDGTLDEVMSGMMECEKRCPIGYLPSGSTNDFANSLKLSKNLLAAAERITQENEFPVDIGRFNSDYFVYIAAFGLFTDVSYETNQDVKNVLGHMAYLLEGAKKLTNIRSYHLRAVLDGDLIVEGEFAFGMITNSVSVGGFRNITGKNVKLDDGVFEVTLVRMPKNLLDVQAILTCLVTRNADDTHFFQTTVSNVDLTFSAPVSWTLDGEYGGDHTDVHVENMCRALTLLV